MWACLVNRLFPTLHFRRSLSSWSPICRAIVLGHTQSSSWLFWLWARQALKLGSSSLTLLCFKMETTLDYQVTPFQFVSFLKLIWEFGEF